MDKRKVPEIFLEQLHLNELKEPHKKKVKAVYHDQLENKLNTLRKSDEQILEKYPPSHVKELILKKAAGEEKQKGKIIPFIASAKFIPIAAAAAALLVVFLGVFVIGSPTSLSSGVVTETTRIKGLKPSIKVYKEAETGIELLKENAKVFESDRIQISYVAGGKGYGTIFSIDGRGIVTLHFPANEYAPVSLEEGGEVALPFSYELDDAPNYEQFYFVTSDDEFDLSEVLRSAYRLAEKEDSLVGAQLDLTEDFEQTSFTLLKGEVK